MECVFIKHGITLRNQGVLLPCCLFDPAAASAADYDPDIKSKYYQKYHLNTITTNINDWRNGPELQEVQTKLKNNKWPKECQRCQEVESAGRQDSVRLNGISSYQHYTDNDIVLEIRPGNTCNFACQTCWPAASSRVSKFYKDAGYQFVTAQNKTWDWKSLDTIKHQIKDIILLGGEPFYDKDCLKFLTWVRDQELTSNIIIFTNGSVIDRDWLENTSAKVTLVFSLDAIGKPAEYIRYGTVWEDVYNNYNYVKSLPNVKLRVNITTSAYNFLYLPELINWLAQDWPSVVTFGVVSGLLDSKANLMNERVFKLEQRESIINRLESAIDVIKKSNIEKMQMANAVNAISGIIFNLRTQPYDSNQANKLFEFINKMDSVKEISISDYCPELARTLSISLDKL